MSEKYKITKIEFAKQKNNEIQQKIIDCDKDILNSIDNNIKQIIEKSIY